jgi:hypothetical protein
MPLPQIHLKTLERQLQVHERRLAMLRRQWDALGNPAAHPDPNPKPRTPQWIQHQRTVLEREIGAHEWLLTLGRDPRFIQAMTDLASNRDFARKVATDPYRAARERGIELPPSTRLHLDIGPDQVNLRIEFDEPSYPFVVTWNSTAGFEDPRSRRRELRRLRLA